MIKILEEYKQIYESNADLLVPDWRDLSKNQLVLKAIDNRNNSCFEGYLSGIMVKFWNTLNTYYNKCKLVVTAEDVHSWVVSSVMYAIDNKPWERESSSVYGKPNAPTIVINRCIESRRLTFYQQLNRYNKKINSLTLSLDSLTSDYKDVYCPTYEDEYQIEIVHIVKAYFDKKDYFMAYLIDSISYEMYDVDKDLKRLTTHLKTMSDEYKFRFSSRYEIPMSQIEKSVPYMCKLTRNRIKFNIERNVNYLRFLYERNVI